MKEKEDNPRTLIGGLEIQKKEVQSLQAQVDWLSFTLFNVDVSFVINFLWDWEDAFIEKKGGGYGYRNRVEKNCGGIKIYYSVNGFHDKCDEEGIHVEISGKGIKKLNRPMDSLLYGIVKKQSNITRIDLAVDDFYKKINLNTVEKHVRKKYLTSRFKTSTITVKVPLQGSERELGKTIYFGEPRESDIFFRFYDKKKEQIKQNGYCEYDSWTRLEIVFKRNHAMMIAVMLVSFDMKNIKDIIFSTFRKYLTFRKYNATDSNKSRWEVCRWWKEFIESDMDFNFTKTKEEESLDKSYTWISKQVSKSMYMLFQAFDCDFNMLQRLLIDGEKKIKPTDLEKIKAFQEKYRFEDGENINFLNYEQIRKEIKNHHKIKNKEEDVK